MNAVVRIARDINSVRLILKDQSDAVYLQELGPYEFLENDREYIFFAGTGRSCVAILNEGGTDRGLRFMFPLLERKEVEPNRFGPYDVEVDLYNPSGFSIDLPPIHELPWPHLVENERYCVVSQIVLTIAERALSANKHLESDKALSSFLATFTIPDLYRQYFGRGTRRAVIEKMEQLRVAF